MSMTGAGLTAAVKSAIQALPAESGGGNIIFTRDDILSALCTAIVTYIQDNMTVASAGTVTSGAGAGGSLVAASTDVE